MRRVLFIYFSNAISLFARRNIFPNRDSIEALHCRLSGPEFEMNKRKILETLEGLKEVAHVANSLICL